MRDNIQQATEAIEQVLKNYNLGWAELVRYCEKIKTKKRDIWQEVHGMWANKKINPISYERKIRKEMERIIWKE